MQPNRCPACLVSTFVPPPLLLSDGLTITALRPVALFLSLFLYNDTACFAYWICVLVSPPLPLCLERGLEMKRGALVARAGRVLRRRAALPLTLLCVACLLLASFWRRRLPLPDAHAVLLEWAYPEERAGLAGSTSTPRLAPVAVPLPLLQAAEALPRAPGSAAARSFPFPRVLHQMHATLERLSPLEKLLAERCKAVNADFEYRFWSDAAMDAFVAREYPQQHEWWHAMTPFIKKADTSRYLLMHYFGGAYVDLDVDCINPISRIAADLPRGTAWIGGYPEPFQLMSDRGNAFWLFMVERIRGSLANQEAWTSTGPSGLNDAAKAYVQLKGRGVLMPFVSCNLDPAWLAFLGDSNQSVPWFVDNVKLPNDTRRDGGGVGLGFWPNQVRALRNPARSCDAHSRSSSGD